MRKFALYILLLIVGAACHAERPAVARSGDTLIVGEAMLTADELYRCVSRHNPNFDKRIAEAFITVGKKYGIRGDIALCQAVLETGWFRFDDGTAVKSEHYNFGGLGVTGNGEPHNVYNSIVEGVTALIQHLYAYATTKPLPHREQLVDARFRLVSRGSAPTWELLSGRWSMNANYGRDILRIYTSMLRSSGR